MRRQFLTDGAIYGGATLATGVTSVLLVSMYTRLLDRSEYGVVEYVAALQLLVQVLVGLEVTQGIARYYGGAETELERRGYAATGFWYLTAAYGTVCIAFFVGADVVGPALLGVPDSRDVFRAALISMYAGIMFYVVRTQLRWEFRAGRYAAATAAAAIVTIVASAYLLLAQRAGVTGVFTALSLGYATGIVASLHGLRSTYVGSFDAAKLRRMLAFSVPLTVSTLALFAAGYSDRLVIRAAVGFDELGVYAAGAKVASVIALATAGFQLAAAPLIYRNFERPETPEALAQLFRFFLGGGLVGVLALVASSPEVMALLTTPAYADAWRVVPLLALSTVLASGYILLPGLTVRNMTPRFSAINVTAASVSVILIIALVGTRGITGAAIGSLGGATAGFLLHAFFSHRAYPTPVDWRRVFAAIATVLLAIAMAGPMGRADAVLLIARSIVCLAASIIIILLLSTRTDRAAIFRSVAAAFRHTRSERPS